MRRLRHLLAGALFATALAQTGALAASSATTAEAAGLPASAAGLSRLGAGRMTWFGVRIYDAVFYAERPGLDWGARFALVLRYGRAFDGAAIAERSIEEIAALGLGAPEARARWGEAMRALLPDVARGESLAGVHLPGRGVRFYHNDRAIGTIADPAFARAFFGIWFDERTRVPELRAALLGAVPGGRRGSD